MRHSASSITTRRPPSLIIAANCLAIWLVGDLPGYPVERTATAAARGWAPCAAAVSSATCRLNLPPDVPPLHTPTCQRRGSRGSPASRSPRTCGWPGRSNGPRRGDGQLGVDLLHRPGQQRRQGASSSGGGLVARCENRSSAPPPPGRRRPVCARRLVRRRGGVRQRFLRPMRGGSPVSTLCSRACRHWNNTPRGRRFASLATSSVEREQRFLLARTPRPGSGKARPAAWRSSARPPPRCARFATARAGASRSMRSSSDWSSGPRRASSFS